MTHVALGARRGCTDTQVRPHEYWAQVPIRSENTLYGKTRHITCALRGPDFPHKAARASAHDRVSPVNNWTLWKGFVA